MNVNQLIARVVWAFIGIGLVVVIALSVGCAITATIQLPNGEEALYHGPKKAEMWLKEKDREVKYTGMSAPWYSPFLAIFAGAASNAAKGGSETNINLSP